MYVITYPRFNHDAGLANLFLLVKELPVKCHAIKILQRINILSVSNMRIIWENKSFLDQGMVVCKWLTRRAMTGSNGMVPHSEILVWVCSWRLSRIYRFPQPVSISCHPKAISSIMWHWVWSAEADSYAININFEEFNIVIWISHGAISRQTGPVSSYITH